MPEQNPDNRIAELEKRLKRLEDSYATHQHNNSDGTIQLRKNIVLDQDQYLTFGSGQLFSDQTSDTPTNVGRWYHGRFMVGSQMQLTTTYQSPNMELVLFRRDDNSFDYDAVYAEGTNLVFPYENVSISTTAGGSTVTINGYNFAANSLVGYINIYDSNGDFVEAQAIQSNTATVITIIGTWINSTSGGSFNIYRPVLLGTSEKIWQRLQLETGTSGGILFGAGEYIQGTVSQLFVNPTTFDLEYSYPFGGNTVNLTAGNGVSDTFTTADAKTVTVVDGIITSIV